MQNRKFEILYLESLIGDGVDFSIFRGIFDPLVGIRPESEDNALAVALFAEVKIKLPVIYLLPL